MAQHRGQRVIGVPLGVHVTSSSNPEENTQYRIGGDIFVLLDEVLNSTTRSICVYGRVGNIMLEDGTFVEGPDDMIEDVLDDAFDDEMMIALAQCLPFNSSLLAVNINGVAVTDAGVVAVCRALVNTNVRLIDLTNTVIDDETGVALLELAQANLYLRTVIVDETLIAENLMDEIDMACLNNEALVPSLPPPAAIDQNRMRFCVPNFFQLCPDGIYCAWAHGSPPMPQRGADDAMLVEATQSTRSLASVAARAKAAQSESRAAARDIVDDDDDGGDHLHGGGGGGANSGGAAAAPSAPPKFTLRRPAVAGSTAPPSTAATAVPATATNEPAGSAPVNAAAAAATASAGAGAMLSGDDCNDDAEDDVDAAAERQGLIIKGVATMAVAGAIAWILLRRLG